MKDVLNDYEVNKSTMALLSAAHIDYCTIVLEQNRQLFVRKTPMKLIKASCLDGGSSYEGRRTAVTYHIGAKQKVPIPINPRENIFAFPTHSPDAFECSWIFYNHVKSIKPNNSPIEKTTHQSIITFKNEQQIIMDESHYILEKQMQRTAICILLFQLPLITQPY